MVNCLKSLFKILTFMALYLFCTNTHGQILTTILSTEVASTHLRLNLFSPKEQFVVDKRGNSLLIRTLNVEAYKNLSEELKANTLPSKYISKIEFHDPGMENGDDKVNISTVKLSLASNEVEVFSFYRDKDSKYIIDFWVEEKDTPVPTPVAQIPSPPPVPTAAPKKIATPPKKIVESPKKQEKKFRDFRYGASFIWNYEPLMPQLESSIDLKSKTPEYFYPIKDIEINSDLPKAAKERLAHLQLNINMYRSGKLGLMNKSIDLYYKKYGDDKDYELNEFLKANAIAKSYLDGAGSESLKVAINMYKTLLAKSSEYEFRKAIYKYLVEYYLGEKEFVSVLQMSKKFYVDARENFDYEGAGPAAEIILYALVHLKQIESVLELIKDKTIEKTIPRQKILAYLSSIHLMSDRIDEVIKIYEDNKVSFAGTIHSSIIYNTAEAYFRKGDYEKSLKLFDDFIVNYSQMHESGHARLRLALAYDILDKTPDEISELYRNAINRSQNHEVSYEARIRYVGLRSVRKIKLDDSDKEVRIFLEQDKRHVIKPSTQLNELLWLVRLRTFINDGEYKNALSYLSALQLDAMRPDIRRVFEADGAEIVYGLMKENYKNAQYSEVIKIWEIYKNKYITKIGNDPHMNFIVGNSALKLGLYNIFEKHLDAFKKLESSPLHIFPIWVSRGDEQLSAHESNKRVMTELSLVKNIKLKNWDLASENLKELEKMNNKYLMLSYYKAQINFEKRNYSDAIKFYEDYLAREKGDTLYDPLEIAELFKNYTDALYETRQLEKFVKVSRAVLNDTKKIGTNNVYMRNVREKIAYLTLEINFNGDMNQTELENFIQEYPESHYLGRVKYLLGMSYIKTDNSEMGKKYFDSMLEDKMIPEHIKELVRGELSLLKIREKTI